LEEEMDVKKERKRLRDIEDTIDEYTKGIKEAKSKLKSDYDGVDEVIKREDDYVLFYKTQKGGDWYEEFIPRHGDIVSEERYLEYNDLLARVDDLKERIEKLQELRKKTTKKLSKATAEVMELAAGEDVRLPEEKAEDLTNNGLIVEIVRLFQRKGKLTMEQMKAYKEFSKFGRIVSSDTIHLTNAKKGIALLKKSKGKKKKSNGINNVELLHAIIIEISMINTSTLKKKSALVFKKVVKSLCNLIANGLGKKVRVEYMYLLSMVTYLDKLDIDPIQHWKESLTDKKWDKCRKEYNKLVEEFDELSEKEKFELIVKLQEPGLTSEDQQTAETTKDSIITVDGKRWDGLSLKEKILSGIRKHKKKIIGIGAAVAGVAAAAFGSKTILASSIAKGTSMAARAVTTVAKTVVGGTSIVKNVLKGALGFGGKIIGGALSFIKNTVGGFIGGLFSRTALA
jgi:hypothetical protein